MVYKIISVYIAAAKFRKLKRNAIPCPAIHCPALDSIEITFHFATILSIVHLQLQAKTLRVGYLF